ncbi:FtsX-like permease family protein [Amycolatopsis sp. NPDC059027]|uniref:FtsX-like permease family protein n=1 Tax=Amycolatopsis sp. NPDC059027 TaxID=3346709 RepID=UPI003670A677
MLGKDIAFGIRLSAGGGRLSHTAVPRLLLTASGIALAVSMLLAAASAANVVKLRGERVSAAEVVTRPIPGVAPLYHSAGYTRVRGDQIQTERVAASGASSPVPPGLSRLPAPGELVVSPALGEKLAAPDGVSLRARFPGTVVGVLGKPGLHDAGELRLYAGAEAAELAADPLTGKVYGFGGPDDGFALHTRILLLVVPLSVVLLLPLLIFVTTASRMGAAQRERRLAALRLLGVDAVRIRRIAAAESLLGAFAGLGLGGVLFLGLHAVIGRLDLFGFRVFGEDFVPSLPSAAAVVVLVPVLAMGAAVFGLRHTVVEPLGVVRHSRQVDRMVWWRWAITGAGVALLTYTFSMEKRTRDGFAMFAVGGGAALVLLGIVALLPWAVERIVGRLTGGPPSWQLAMRRLHLDSGTAGRVVAGLVVVLAGMILVQNVLTTIKATAPQPLVTAMAGAPVEIQTRQQLLTETLDRAGAAPGVSGVHVVRTVHAERRDYGSGRLQIGDCAALALRARIGSCHDGDVFAVDARPDGDEAPLAPGPVRLDPGPHTLPGHNGPEWTVPAAVRHVPATEAAPGADGFLLVTPGAMHGIDVAALGVPVGVLVTGPGRPRDLADRVADALGPLNWRVSVRAYDPASDAAADLDRQSALLREVTLTASVFVLAVATLSLFMLSVEQITERRRLLAAMVATGVPLAVLARSLLWQTALPVVAGVLLALGAGMGFTLPILRLAGSPVVVDPATLGGLLGTAVLAVLVVTGLTFPLLRRATRITSSRAE